MFKYLCLSLFLLLAVFSEAQQGLVPIQSFYKDQLLANKSGQPYNEGSFYPANELDYNLLKYINDSTKQYYKVTSILFKKHVVDLKREKFHLKISPIMNFAMGRDLSDTVSRNLFQNTRGVHVECDLLHNFSFSTSLYENQGRFSNYESDYYQSIGELYPSTDTTYNSQNAMIPGGARTKPFKGDGFDYAFAVGYFMYQPFKWARITAGNNALFIGDGHRSILLSDNHSNAPYFRLDFKISPKWSYSYARLRNMNLVRKKASSSVEAYYEPKGLSINYLTFKPTPKMTISLFESGQWNRTDSTGTSRNAHPLFYNPIPGFSQFLIDKSELSSLIGLNFGAQVANKHRIYAQFGMYEFDTDKVATQIGYRGYDFFGLKDFLFQFEYNYVSSQMYQGTNRRLNYTNYNLSLGPIKGNGFSEFLMRTNYTIKRIYAELEMDYYILKDYRSLALMPIDFNQNTFTGATLFTNLEIGYRFNRKMNLSVFGSWTYRATTAIGVANANLINVGIKTGFVNHYKDF